MELDNGDENERGVIASMVWRLKELRKGGHLTVAHDHKLKRTVFVLQEGVEIDKSHRYKFGGRLLYVLTGRD
ncbi:MAG: hypothetical protein HWN51_00740 [Desulfobacterales bacterium]|nr:hypothetical protein [Desulfobacterales bacterium]